MDINEFNTQNRATWCMGCGNYSIHIALKKALFELNISPSQTFISFDIGCNGNGADKIRSYAFKGLHGRSIALASGAHLANRRFTVIADIGDGGCIHEGLDHLIHAVRSNYDITILIHNNSTFALTTGQATAMTNDSKPMYGLPDGIPERNLDLASLLLSLRPSFFARGFSGDPLQLTELLRKGIEHKGCSVIEIMQLCPSYNKECNLKWYMENIVKVSDIPNYVESDLDMVRDTISLQNGKIVTGLLYKDDNMPTFYDSLENRKDKHTELVDEVSNFNIKNLLSNFD